MRVENPLSGWPETAPLQGEPGYRITARYFTPEGAKWTNLLTSLLLTGAMFLMFMALLDDTFDNGLQAGGIFIAAMLAFWAGRYWLASPLFGKKLRVEIRPDVIRIGGFMGYKNYDRRLPHEFAYSLHDRAQAEAQNTARVRPDAAARKEALAVSKYYRHSWHIILRYAGQRVDVASIFGKKKAEALLTRFQLLDAMMDAAAGEVTGPARPEPATQYGKRPEAS